MKTTLCKKFLITTITIFTIIIGLFPVKNSVAFYQGSSAGYVTKITARDNGMYVVFLSAIPDQGCTFSDRAALSPDLTGADNILETIELAIAAHWKVVLFVDGCVNHTESADNPEYDSTETVPRLVHAALIPE